MFRACKLLKSQYAILSYQVTFSDFETIVTIPEWNPQYVGGTLVEILIIKACLSNQRVVSRTLANFYVDFFRKHPRTKQATIVNLQYWRDIIDKHCPELEYGKKYYTCVLRIIQQSYGAIL